jgi:soluble lytic murein transglycosylase-like protein
MARDNSLWYVLGAAGILYLLSQTNAGQSAIQSGITTVLGSWQEKAAANASDLWPDLSQTIAQAEVDNGIPSGLLLRLAYQESHFRPDIINGTTVSSAGAQGLMQLVPAYYPGIDPLNTDQAIDAAAQSLVTYFNRFGSWPLALAAYNAGPGNVQKYKGIPPFTETQNYVTQILADVPAANS